MTNTTRVSSLMEHFTGGTLWTPSVNEGTPSFKSWFRKHKDVLEKKRSDENAIYAAVMDMLLTLGYTQVERSGETVWINSSNGADIQLRPSNGFSSFSRGTNGYSGYDGDREKLAGAGFVQLPIFTPDGKRNVLTVTTVEADKLEMLFNILTGKHKGRF